MKKKTCVVKVTKSRFLTFLLLLILPALWSCKKDDDQDEISSNTLSRKVQFASLARGQALLSQEDEYTNRLSIFDLQFRTRTIGQTVSKSDFLAYVATQALSWEEAEKVRISRLLHSIDQKLERLQLKLPFPPTIELVKSTLREEGGAQAYTRANYIVLSSSFISTASDDKVERIIIHEFFHILTRSNPQLQKRLFSIIGFAPTNEVAYPVEIRDRRLTNPDAPFNNTYIKVNYNGQPVEAMMIIFSTEDYRGGERLNDYMNVGLLVVEGDDNAKQPKYVGGQPVIVTVAELANVSGFFEQIGNNTSYILHPEEILAENFVLLLNQTISIPNPEIITKMKEILSQ
jgi:hypothetical protein